jgi:kinesin family protein 11
VKTKEVTIKANSVDSKTYTFDRVFGPGADQITVYNDVVVPILEEVSDELYKICETHFDA